MKTTLYTYVDSEMIMVSGRNSRKNPERDDQRYKKLLEKRGLSIEDVQTYMLVENDGKNVLLSYMFSKSGWLIAANHGKTTVCYGPMSLVETATETLDICKRLGLCG